jgi:1-acyl-sn-glycerol-3-phosphate acyltransferase
MLAAARAAVDQGRPILIFPEGTRVAPGEQPPLQPGFRRPLQDAGSAGRTQLPSMRAGFGPAALSSRKPVLVTMQVGRAIPPGLPRREIEARVHAALNALETGR